MVEDVVSAAYRVLPCYLVVDSSGSMRGDPIATINAELPKLRLKMLRDSELAEVCQLALVTFGEEARLVVPLTEVEHISFPAVAADGRRTDYRRPFTLLRDSIRMTFTTFTFRAADRIDRLYSSSATGCTTWRRTGASRAQARRPG